MKYLWKRWVPAAQVGDIVWEELMWYKENTAVPLMYWKYPSSEGDMGDLTWDDITGAKAEAGDQQADRVSDTVAVLLAPESRVVDVELALHQDWTPTHTAAPIITQLPHPAPLPDHITRYSSQSLGQDHR